MRTWLASPERGLKITGTTAHVSAIFDWFGDDFAKDQAGRLAWIGRFLTPERRAQLQQAKAVKSLDWDWALNRQPERRPAAPRRASRRGPPQRRARRRAALRASWRASDPVA